LLFNGEKKAHFLAIKYVSFSAIKIREVFTRLDYRTNKSILDNRKTTTYKTNKYISHKGIICTDPNQY